MTKNKNGNSNGKTKVDKLRQTVKAEIDRLEEEDFDAFIEGERRGKSK